MLIDGFAPLDDVRQRLGIEPADVPAETVAGLVLDLLGRLASVGDAVTVEDVRFEVLAVDGHRIERVRASREAGTKAGV